MKRGAWRELVKAIAWWAMLPERRVERVLHLFGDEVLEAAAAGRDVHWPGIGTFSRATRKARRIRNPATKELVELPAMVSVKFKAAKAAKERLK